MPELKNILLGFLLILAAFVAFSLFGFLTAIRPPKIHSDLTPAEFGLKYEEVKFKTEDDVELVGWFVPRKGEATKKTIVVMHGYPADKGNVLPLVAPVAEDANLFLYDFRYLGQSGGAYTTAGAKEVADLKAALKFLKERGIEEVGVCGFSMGGAVALMTAADSPEIKAVVSDSTYSRLFNMVEALYRIPFFDRPLVELTRGWGRLFFGMDAKAVSPAEKVRQLNIPVFIIHSEDDRTIPFKNALEIQANLKKNPKAQYWFYKGYQHGEIPPDYSQRVREFFRQNLP